jgi:hypothetical protein
MIMNCSGCAGQCWTQPPTQGPHPMFPSTVSSWLTAPRPYILFDQWETSSQKRRPMIRHESPHRLKHKNLSIFCYINLFCFLFPGSQNTDSSALKRYQNVILIFASVSDLKVTFHDRRKQSSRRTKMNKESLRSKRPTDKFYPRIFKRHKARDTSCLMII